MEYKVVLTSDAEEDLNRFIRYLLFVKQNPQAAANVLNDFEKTKRILSNIAASMKLCDDPRLSALGYRKMYFHTHPRILCSTVLRVTLRSWILFQSGDITLSVPISPDRETVWLTQDQMSVLFDTARSSIAYHIGKIFSEGELNRDTSVEIFDRSTGNASRSPMYYNLDVIISVGYRVKSKRGVEFRKWANSVLKDYILRGYAVNETRIRQLGEVVRLMKRTQNDEIGGMIWTHMKPLQRICGNP